MNKSIYWVLFLGQTIRNVTILSHLIPLFRRLVSFGIGEKPPGKYPFLQRLDNP